MSAHPRPCYTCRYYNAHRHIVTLAGAYCTNPRFTKSDPVHGAVYPPCADLRSDRLSCQPHGQYWTPRLWRRVWDNIGRLLDVGG